MGVPDKFRRRIAGVEYPLPREEYLFKLAEEYHYQTEKFDSYICLEKQLNGIAKPSSASEYSACSDNAKNVFCTLGLHGWCSEHQITSKELQDRIKNDYFTDEKILEIVRKRDSQ